MQPVIGAQALAVSDPCGQMAHRWLREWLGFPNWSSLISTSSRCRQGVTGRIPIAWTRPSALVAERGHVLAAGARPRHDCCARPAGLGRGDSAPAPAALVPAAHGLGFPSWARPPCANTARRRVARSPVGTDAWPPRRTTRALPRQRRRGRVARGPSAAVRLPDESPRRPRPARCMSVGARRPRPGGPSMARLPGAGLRRPRRHGCSTTPGFTSLDARGRGLTARDPCQRARARPLWLGAVLARPPDAGARVCRPGERGLGHGATRHSPARRRNRHRRRRGRSPAWARPRTLPERGLRNHGSTRTVNSLVIPPFVKTCHDQQQRPSATLATKSTSACADGDGETARWMPGQNRSVESKDADNVLE